MRYRIAAPSSEACEPRRLDIVDPVRTAEARELAERGLCDVEPATHAPLLALLDQHDGQVALLDLEPGVGLACVMCAQLFGSSTVIAVAPDGAAAARVNEVASANGVSIDVHTDLAEAIRSVPPDRQLVVRLGADADISAAVDAVTACAANALPPVVINGGRARSSWVTWAVAHGYDVYPLQRFPTWRRLDKKSSNARADGWLLLSMGAPNELRETHSVWAGAIGTCTPDRNDRHPFMAELRSRNRSPETTAGMPELARRDLAREARAAWHRVDPWMPSPYSRAGRLIGRMVSFARQLLAGRNVPGSSASGHGDVGDDQRHARRAHREPFDVAADFDDVEQHSLQRRRDRELADRGADRPVLDQ